MMKAIFFDLDETLLDINLSAFIAKYIAGRAQILSRVTRISYPQAVYAISKSYVGLEAKDRQDGLLNEQFLKKEFTKLTRKNIDFPELDEALRFYDAKYIDRFNGSIVKAAPKPGIKETITAARKLGLSVVLATNPTFSLECDLVRMSWAGLSESDFDYISHTGNCHFCKPDARYYQELLDTLGYEPHEVMMVGNDVTRDFPKPDIGLKTAYVGHGWPKQAIWTGTIKDLKDDLPMLQEGLNLGAWD